MALQLRRHPYRRLDQALAQAVHRHSYQHPDYPLVPWWGAMEESCRHPFHLHLHLHDLHSQYYHSGHALVPRPGAMKHSGHELVPWRGAMKESCRHHLHVRCHGVRCHRVRRHRVRGHRLRGRRGR